MSDATQLPVTQTLVRRRFVVCALLALIVVLARPICDAYHVHQLPSSSSQTGPTFVSDHAIGNSSHHEDSEPCCAFVEGGNLAAPATALAPVVKSSVHLLVATASLPGGFSPGLARNAAIPPERPPHPQPYYARSTRILI
jgi:hypothetical protein